MNRFCVLVLIAGLFVGCGGDRFANCEFRPGDMVRSKVSGAVGQVILMRPNPRRGWCYADVRFQAPTATTDARLLDDDQPITIQPLGVVRNMRPYELEHVD